jgi:hypothetical protein
MSIKVKLLPNALIVWPNKCVQCGCPATRKDTTHKERYRGKGFYLFFFTYTQEIYKISYPVCFKHLVYAKFCRFLFWLLLFPVIVMGLVTFLPYFLDSKFEFGLVIYFIVFSVIFLLSIKLQPLRITKANEDGIVLDFRNEKIAKEFSLANKL